MTTHPSPGSEVGVDVLSVLQDCIFYLSQKDDLAGYELGQMESDRAAVAELIDASSAYYDDCAGEYPNDRLELALDRVGAK